MVIYKRESEKCPPLAMLENGFSYLHKNALKQQVSGKSSGTYALGREDFYNVFDSVWVGRMGPKI